ncbi:MAG: ABC transporter permease [Chloroflexi bacterium]|nr:ABC transporter permease [Chloroflexota bacterium]
MTTAAPHARPAATSFPTLFALSRSRTAIEIKLFFRNTDQVFFTFLLPVLFLVLFSAIFSGDIDAGPGRRIDFPTYFLPGIVASGAMSTTFVNLATSIAVEQREGLLKRLAGTPLPREAFFIGRLMMAVVVTVAQTAIMLVIGVFVYDVGTPPTPERWAFFVALLALSAAVGAVLGIAYTRLIRDARSASAIVQPPFLVLQFISGVFFRWNDLPPWLQAIATLFPLRWIAEGFRYAFLPDWFGKFEYGDSWGWQLPLVILAAWLALAFALAMRFFRWDIQPDR